MSFGDAGVGGGPLFYDDLVADYVRADGYVRRSWLEETVLDRLARHDCRYVLLVAEPGAGKTGIMAGLAERYPQWLRYFIRRDSTTPLSGGDAASLLIRIGHQFAARQPALFDPQRLEVIVSQRVTRAGPGSNIVGVRIEDLQVSPFRSTAIRVEQEVAELDGKMVSLEVTHARTEPRLLEPQALQYLALLDPAAVLSESHPDRQVVVLIDALDEVLRFRTGMSVLDWLERCPELPPNVRFVLASRPHPRLEALTGVRAGSVEVIDLDAMSASVEKDTRVFARRLMATPAIAAHLSNPDAADRLAAASKGNFAYLRAYERGLVAALRDGSEAALDTLLRLDRLPVGLGALYAAFLRNARADIAQLGMLDIEQPTGPGDEVAPAWEGAGQRMLGVLAVARAPLTLEQLMHLGAIRVWPSGASNVMQYLTPFLDKSGHAWQLFHPSVAEFLTHDAAAEAPDLGISSAEWHHRVVRAYRGATTWADVDWQSVDDYGLLHLAEHLAELGEAGHREIPALICPGLRAAARARFLTDLPFRRIIDTGLAYVGEYTDPGTALAATVFLDVTRAALSHSEQFAPAVYGLMAVLGRGKEAQARVDLLPPGEHQFVSQQALVACMPAAQRTLLGGHDGADRLVGTALDITANDHPVHYRYWRTKAVTAAAVALLPHDEDRAISLAVSADDESGYVLDTVLGEAALTVELDVARRLIGRMRAGRAAVAVDVALQAAPDEREEMLLLAQRYVDSEPCDTHIELKNRIRALAGLVTAWHPLAPDRAALAANELRELILERLGSGQLFPNMLQAVLDAAPTIHEVDPEFATRLLNHVVEHDVEDNWVWAQVSAVGLWAAWGEHAKVREQAERLLDRALQGTYNRASNIALLSVQLHEADPVRARQLADMAEQLATTPANRVHEEVERAVLGVETRSVAEAFRHWDPERALRLARCLDETSTSGTSWDSFDRGRQSALACLGIDAVETDPDLARRLLEECIPQAEAASVLGRRDTRLLRGGLFRPAEDRITGMEPGDSFKPSWRERVALTYALNAASYWGSRRQEVTFGPPGVVVHVMSLAPSSVVAGSWASVVAAAVGPVGIVDLNAAIDMAGWLSDPCERLIANAWIARLTLQLGDDRAAAALAAVGRAAIALPRYAAELDFEKFNIAQGPALAYLNPSARARWEAAILLPSTARPTADALTAADGSWYLSATLSAQRMFEALIEPAADNANSETIIGKVERILASVENHPDDVQRDLIRSTAAAVLAKHDVGRAGAVAARITHPGRALVARIMFAPAAAAGVPAFADTCRKLLDDAKDAPPLHRAAAAAVAVNLLGNTDPAVAGALADEAAAALDHADPPSAARGLLELAAVTKGSRQKELLSAALRRTDDVANGYERRDVLAYMLYPAALSADPALLSQAVRKVHAAGWRVLMEGMRRAVVPLVTVCGPRLLADLDEALWAAQRVIGRDALPGHLDGVAAQHLRARALDDPTAVTVTECEYDYGSYYLAAEDLPGMTYAPDLDYRIQVPRPGDYAFDTCSGLHASQNRWEGKHSDRIWQLIDIRFVFPDAERAAAYHAERLLANSEGYPPVTGVPVTGQDCHVFRGIVRAGDRELAMCYYVFRVGSVVVKLFAAQGAEAARMLHPEDLYPLACRITSKIGPG